MTITMNHSKKLSFQEIEKFLKGSSKLSFKGINKKESYQWIEDILDAYNYANLNRSEKGIIRAFIIKVSGYSRAQSTRLILHYNQKGIIEKIKYERHKFQQTYCDSDINLLAKTDELHDFPNGAAIKTILGRMSKVDLQYKNIANISVAHIYNLRRSTLYKTIAKRYEKTCPKISQIAQRAKPQPKGQPGFIRVDSVHQGDRDKTKGIYHINTVDEVTQFEAIAAVEKITEKQMIPILKKLIETYPFKIKAFHSDNGSEYINKYVADLFNKLLIKFTKSRPRKSNDNALVESKNGSVIRKWMSYGFIDSSFASDLNKFYFLFFNEYLNFHRPCAFPFQIKSSKGKIKNIYKLEDYKTPYGKFKSLENAQQYLKKTVSFKQLDSLEKRYDDNQMAFIIQTQRTKLFNKIFPH